MFSNTDTTCPDSRRAGSGAGQKETHSTEHREGTTSAHDGGVSVIRAGHMRTRGSLLELEQKYGPSSHSYELGKEPCLGKLKNSFFNLVNAHFF